MNATMPMPAKAQVWGANRHEVTDVYPCEAYIPEPRERLLRAVTVGADAGTTFRWVCQLKIAPYSYDVLDNLGRRSPRRLTPGVEHLEVGQRFLVFTVTEYDAGRHLTGASTPAATRLFGPMALTYRIEQVAPGRSRLVACLTVTGGGGRLRRLRAGLLSYGDLVMMRKQLLTLKSCAEASTARAV